MPVIYSARWVLPIISPLIENGAVAIDSSTIIAVGSHDDVVSSFPDSRIENFGEAAILPGLVNTHSHLELTVMRGFLEREENDFFAWLRKLTVARLAMTAEDLFVSATCGAIEAARAGVTSLGDACSVAKHGMKAMQAVGLRGIVYQESFGPDAKLAEANVAQLREQVSELRALENDLVQVGVSPHAPYSVSGRQLELISRLAIDERLPLMMHAAESQSEKLFMMEGQGPFADGLRARNIEWQAPGVSTIKYLERHGVLETRPLFAHCINVDEADLDLIKQSSAGIAHCPKSNAKLGHGSAPFAEFINRELRVGFGSDSVASYNTCDIVDEARFATLLARIHPFSGELLPAVTAEQAIFTATLGGARAIGLDSKVGSLAAGLQADLAVVNLDGAHQRPGQDPAATLLFASSGRDVLLTVVGGSEIYRDGRMSGVDESEFQRRLEQIRIKIDSATALPRTSGSPSQRLEDD